MVNQPTQKLLALFNIQSGEGKLVAWVLLYAILLYTANVLARTASYALFLTEFDAATLPYAYVGIAIFATLISTLLLRLNERFSLAKVLIGVHLFLLLTLAGYWLGIGLASGPWLLFSLPIYFGVNNSLTISSFWNLLGRIFNLQQGKRLFGLLSSGEHMATIATGFLAPLLVSWLGTANLFLLAALVMIATVALLWTIIKNNTAKMAEPAEEKSSGRDTQKPAESLFKDSYVRLIIGLFALFIVGVYFVDNIFYSQAELRYPNEDELAAFIGVFFGVMAVLSLFMQTFVAGRVLTRFGVKAMILATPTGLLALMIPFALVGTFTSWLQLIFWLIVAANMYRLILDAVDSAAVNVMYQPLPARQRTQAQTTVIGIVYPLAIGFTGLAILFFTGLLGFSPLQLSYILLFILLAWLMTGVALGRAYPKRLQRALTQGNLEGMALPRPDRSSLAIFEQGLTSPQVGVILYSLDMLEVIAPESLSAYLPDLLGHPEREVRLETLRRVERLSLKEALPLIQSRFKSEGSLPVQGASLRVLATLGEPDTFEQIYPYLDNPNPYLRQGALIGLLRSGELEGILTAGDKLLAGVNSPQPAEREFAAHVLGEAELTGLYRPLLKLLRDEQPPVQRAALAAAGKVRHPRLWPAAIECLDSPAARSAAVTALAAGGEAALPDVQLAFTQAGQTGEVLVRLARVCGRIGGPQVITLLQEYLDFPQVQVRSEVLAALNRCGYQADPAARPAMQQAIKQEAAQAAWCVASLVDLGEAEAVSLLKTALNRTLAGHQERLFLWLSFYHDPGLIRQVRDNLCGASVEKRAYALEIIQVGLDPALRPVLFPLLDDLPPADRLQQLSPIFPQPRLTRPARLSEIIGGSAAWLTPWTKACALEAVARLGAVELAETVVAALAAPEPLLRETALWTLARLDVALYQGHAAALAADPDPQVAGLVRQLAVVAGGVPETNVTLASQGDQIMLSTVEKVIRLKGTDFFADTSEETLVEMAALLETMEVPAGETFMAAGEVDSSLYLLIDGQVRVHEGERTVATLGEGDVLGELALLDPAPRSASATALTETRLFRLDQAPFYELLEDHSEVARKMLQLLARRLRRSRGETKAERARDDLLGGLKERLTKKP